MAPARRPRSISIRTRLTLSYVLLLGLAVTGLLGAMSLFLLRYITDEYFVSYSQRTNEQIFVPNRTELLSAFVPVAAGVIVLLLIAGTVGGWLLARRILAPLDELTRVARLVAADGYSHRVADMPSRDEFDELAEAFNAMLEQTEAHVREQERFAANASHELRTPLTITKTMLDVARRDTSPDMDHLLADLSSVTARSIDLVEALLQLSRADRPVPEAETLDLSLLAEEARDSVLTLAERGGVSLRLQVEPCSALGSTSLLLQLMTNLLHNAIVHNVSAGFVVLRTEQSAEGAVVTVENSGSAIDPTTLPTLLEPFVRGGTRTRRTDGGHTGTGLGLAIVSRIVAAHGGRLTLTAREEGGLLVRVILPSERPEQPGQGPDQATRGLRTGRAEARRRRGRRAPRSR
ncbi:sensor histidine kinase [Rathayibacter tritici]|uniref:histidine kinase n=1 Tax=Rathayibacter tritici TaxID=33888 RepID=A0A160KPR3_9MICO|nr:HAMP domain-containing sensor histidine kinase [Rathayibacter tritici]AND15456.1 two-component sensor histidine kinase [Rathayibacter tritici]